MHRIIIMQLIICTYSFHTYSQSFSINTDGSLADTSAILDVKSSSKGVLVPRLTKAQRNTIFQPSAGLLVFQNGPDSTGFYFFNGNKWLWMISTANIQGADTTAWKKNGNSGTNPITNFVGTTDNQPLNFKVNNVKAGALDHINHNTSLGAGALVNFTGSNTVAIGDSAMFSSTTASDGIAIGIAALKLNTTGSDNAAFGNHSLFNTTTGFSNTGAGNNTLFKNTTGHDNSATGFLALFNNTSGFNNTANGSNALFANTTGSNNTAIGVNALFSNTVGFVNTAVGFGTLFSNTTGSFNTALGEFSLNTNTTGFNNTATGNFSLQLNTTGSNNSATGTKALFANSTGFQNTASGSFALTNNTTGSNNTAMGINALISNTTGNNNTAIGNFAGDVPLAGDNNTYIGFGANNSSGLAFTNSTALGFGSNITASTQVRFGNTSITSIGGFTGYSTIPSDVRAKKNIREDVPGLAFITKLKPVTYNLDLDAIDKIIQSTSRKAPDGKVVKPTREELAERKQKEQIIYTGFIAQDVEKAAKELNYDFSGVDKPKNEKDLYGLRYGEFVVPLVKAIQEQQQTIIDLRKQLETLARKIEKIEMK